MMTRCLLRIRHFLPLLMLALAAPARAQYPAAPPPSSSPDPVAVQVQAPVSEAVLRAVLGKQVDLRLANGSSMVGELLSVDPDTAALVVPGGQVLPVARSQVVEVRLMLPVVAPAAPSPVAAPAEPPLREKKRKERVPETEPVDRHFGLQFGLGPGILMADLDYGLFYGFLSGSLALPMYSLGTDSPVGGVTLAPGLSFKISDDRNWHFDLFASASLGFYGDTEYYGYSSHVVTHTVGSVGVGMGFHYTSQSGFSMGFKVPIIGLAFGDRVNSRESAGGYYYLNALVSFPVATFGYRF
ncbi:MAG: hypothetical protein HY901_16600 [Deltaproteobacteria bacterium]|nr:hypothetical protein [Deltaproteobacteria bacterium]